MQAACFDRSAGPLAFLHLPKAAGTAVAIGLRAAFLPKAEAFGWDLYSFGAFRDFASLDPNLKAKVFVSAQDIRQDADFVVGHLSLSTIRAKFTGAQCMTILREPMSRLLSQWLYMRSHEDHGLAAWGNYAQYHKEARRPLAQFLQCEAVAGHTDNVLARMLLWPSPLIPAEGFIEAADYKTLLDEASRRLASLCFVDVIENGDLFANLSQWLGSPVQKNVFNEATRIPPAMRSPLARELSAQAYDLLRVRTCLDRVLWDKVVTQRLPHIDPAWLQSIVLLNNVARLAPLMASDG